MDKLITRWIVNEFYRKFKNYEYLDEREDFIAKVSTELAKVYKEIIRKEKEIKESYDRKK